MALFNKIIRQYDDWLILMYLNIRMLIWFVYISLAANVTCYAQELPIAEFRTQSELLKKASLNVQGSFRYYRIEKPLEEVFTKSPKELGIPLLWEGELWRDGDRFRADYLVLSNKGKNGGGIQCAIAKDAGKIYEFLGGINGQISVLNIFAEGNPQSMPVNGMINNSFLQPLDTLWSVGGISFSEILQRPGLKTINTSDESSLTLVLNSEDTSTKYIFNKDRRYALNSISSKNKFFELQRRVTFKTINEQIVPTRVIDVATKKGGSGYTTVYEFELSKLETASPISKPISETSFKNFNLEYQIYEFDNPRQKLGELGERFNPAPNLSSATSSSTGSFLLTFLILNGAAILVIFSFLIYRRAKNSNDAQ